ncbi:MAG: AraC family ligand binding domain-containing protein, partial [Planctomycetota bacterium]
MQAWHDDPAQLCPPQRAAQWHARFTGARIAVLSLRTWHTGQQWWVPRRRLGNDWLFLLRSGRLLVDGGRELTAGSVLLVPRGRPHTIRYADGARPRGRMIAVHAACRDAWGGSLLAAAPEPILPLPEARALCRQADGLAGLWQQDETHAAEACSAWLRVLLGQLCLNRDWSAPAAPQMDPRVRRAIAHMRTHLAESPSLPQIAATVGLSPARLRALCVRDCGHSPHRLLQDIRQETAEQQLRG